MALPRLYTSPDFLKSCSIFSEINSTLTPQDPPMMFPLMSAHALEAISMYITLLLPAFMPQVIYAALGGCITNGSSPPQIGMRSTHSLILCLLRLMQNSQGCVGCLLGGYFCSFHFFHDQHYPCALVHWLIPVGGEPDDETSMWVVHPKFEGNHCSLSVIHLDGIV